MAKKILQHLDFDNVSKIQNLPNPTSAQDAATKAYADALAEGNAWKDAARVSTQGNVNLASPGANIDGIALAAGDRVLVRNQTSQPANGIYVWNGAATAMTRAADASTAAELEMAVLYVEEGTDAGVKFRQTQINFVLDTGNVIFQGDSSAAPAASETTAGIAEIATQAEMNAGTADDKIVTPVKAKNASWMIRKFSVTIGDGAATSFAVNHNLGNKDCVVSLYYTGGTFDVVDAEVRMTTANQITVVFAAAPTANQITVVVIG